MLTKEKKTNGEKINDNDLKLEVDRDKNSEQQSSTEILKIRTYYDEDLEGTAIELLDKLCEYAQDMFGETVIREQMIGELVEWHRSLTGKIIKTTDDISEDAKTIFEKTHMLREVNGTKIK